MPDLASARRPVTLPDGCTRVVDDGVLAEPTSAAGRVVLWIPAGRSGGYQRWERVGTLAGTKVGIAHGIRSVAASSIAARQRVDGGLAAFVRRLAGGRGDRGLAIPGGGFAESTGPRRAGLVLAWVEDGARPLDEVRIRAAWPGCGEARSVGRSLYLVSGAGASLPAPASDPDLPGRESARDAAERALRAARDGGEPRRVVTGLVDLALACLYAGDAPRAATLLEEALAESRRLGDRDAEADVSSNLGLADFLLDRQGPAREALVRALAHARDAGSLYAEKLAMERLGMVESRVGDHPSALSLFERAAAIAAGLGDRGHEATLLWRAGIEQAELGRRDRAVACGRAAVDLMRREGQPQAGWYAEHLSGFRAGSSGMAAPAGGIFGGSIDAAAAAPRTPADGPGLLRMALTATGSMARFVGSGFRAADPATYRGRLEACRACDHHTGTRCRLCGCITAAKARLLHEKCPAARWPF